MRRLALLLLVLAPSVPRPTGACSNLPDNQAHELDAAFAGDRVPPSAVTATAAVDRDDAGGGAGCGGAACGNGGNFVWVSVQATDDQAPVSRLGYQLTLKAGQLPAGITLPATPLIADSGDLRLEFLPSDRNFAFDLEVRAVDLNGNLGPATVVAISDGE